MNSHIKESFSRFTWIWFYEREINFLEENISRKDYSYDLLTKNFYYTQGVEKKKLLVFAKLFEAYKDVAFLSKASYIYALQYNWEKALTLMEQVIILEAWKNIDSWVDYGLFLRKFPEYRDISISLLLNLEQAIESYKGEKEIINFLKNIFKK